LHTEYKARKGDINRDKGDKRDKKRKTFSKGAYLSPWQSPREGDAGSLG
jgi:hypothetical protein